MKFSAACLMAVIAGSLPSSAQLTRGYISGTVQDPSGGFVQGARVIATEQATGIKHEIRTNDAGVYRFVALEPGLYSVEFSKSGFETSRVERISLTTAQEVVLNHTLRLSGIVTAVSIEVRLTGLQLSKASPSIERRVSRELLDSLPLSTNAAGGVGTRDVAQLALLAPTTVSHDGVSASGQRPQFNTYLVDGVDNQDPQWQIRYMRPSPELIAEVHIQSHAHSAEFGRGPGATVAAITRGGTNRFPSELWDYFGANWISAESLANKRAGIESVLSATIRRE